MTTPQQPEQQWTYKREPAGMGEWCYGFYRGDTRFFYTETESQARVILPLLNRPAPAQKTRLEICNKFISDAFAEHDAAVAAQARKDLLDKLQYGGLFKMTEDIERAIQSLRQAQR